MEYKKIIIPIILAIFLLSITSVCASEIDTTIASEDTKSMELSIDEIDDDNLQTDEKNIQVADDETLSAQEDDKALSPSMNTYSNLAQEIGSGGNITLQYDYYMYDEGSTITISVADSVIDGKGAVISMAESNIRAFNVTASGVTFKNLTIKNANYNDYGGAIYFTGSGTVTDCNFEDNKANGEHSNGGAVYFQNNGVVRNCNFTGNTATYNGGAVFFSKNAELTNSNFIKNTATYRGGAAYIFEGTGTVLNCSFTDNTATDNRGGAVFIYYGPCTLTNCIFNGNSAKNGSAISSETNLAVAADTCIFKKDSDTTYQTRILSPTLNADNFTTVYGSGEKLTFDLKTNSSIPITNGNISISVYLKDNNTWVGNYSCISGEGWIPDLPVGSYYAIFSTEYAGAQAINRTVTVTMPDARYYINVTSLRTSDKTVNITAKSNIPKNLIWNAKLVFILPNGTEIAANYSENENWWASYTFDEYAVYEINAKYSGLDNVDVSKGNLTIVEFDSVYSSLAREIASGGDNIVLKFDHYTYDNGSTITIGHTCVIDGRGAVIDMAGSNIRAFYANVEVTIKNLIIKNVNFNGDGGAIYFNTNGHVSNCNFINNRITGDEKNGGALYFKKNGDVSNCNFTDNTASYKGGAIYYHESGSTVIISQETFGTVKNCTFTRNTAKQGGGAIYFYGTHLTMENSIFTANIADSDGGAAFMGEGTITNCTFVDNKAKGEFGRGGALNFLLVAIVSNSTFTGNYATEEGGAIYIPHAGSVTNCKFDGNSAKESAGAIYSHREQVAADTCIFKTSADSINANIIIRSPTLNADNFTSVHGSGDKLAFDLKTNSSVPVTDGNISISVYFKDNDNWVGNYSCISGEGWIPELPVGSYYAVFNTEYAGFEPINRTVTITMPNVKYHVNVTSIETNNKTVNITAKTDIPKDILWNGKLTFILPDGTKINATYADGGIWWAVHTFDEYSVYEIGAAYDGLNNVTVNNGTITITKADSTITLENITLAYGESINVTVTTTGSKGITAKIGESEVEVSGFVISIPVLDVGNYTLTVTTMADEDHNPVTKTVNLTVNKADSTLTVDDIACDYGSLVSTVVSITGADAINASVVGHPEAVVKVNGTNITVSGLNAGTYTLTVTTIVDKNHNSATKNATITVNKIYVALNVNDVVLDYRVAGNVTVVAEGATGIVAKIGENELVVDGYVISIPALEAGTYTLTVTAIGDANYNNVTKNATITVNKIKTEITGSAITATYNVNKNLVITLKDSNGKALSGVKVTVNLNGAKTYTTDKNGQLKVSTKGLAPKIYTAKITFNGDAVYDKSAKDIKVTVKKATPKLTAKKKTFKRSVKVKKYSIVLKDNVGKAIKKAKVTIKIGKKTYAAKTNSKGKASFKIKKLTKKGTYKATVTFKGNKYYNKVVKKVKIKIK